MSSLISFYSNGYDATSQVTLDIHNLPKLVHDSTRDIITKISQIRNTSDKNIRTQLKLQLPMFTASGVFYSRHNNCIKEYSNYICLDFDFNGFADPLRYKALMDSFKTVPYVFTAFKSPSGGIKVIVCHNNTDPLYHSNLFDQLKALPQFGVPEFDDSGRNLCRSCFLSWDPDIYVNKNAVQYDFHYDPANDYHPYVPHTYHSVMPAIGSNYNHSGLVNNFVDGIADHTIINWMDKHEWRCNPQDYQEGNRQTSLMKKAGRMASWGIGYDAAKHILLYKYKYYGLSEEDIVKAVDYCYEHNAFGSKRSEFLEKLNAPRQTSTDKLNDIFNSVLKK